MLAKTKIAVIGAGKLGEAMIGGMIDAGVVKKQQFIATAAHREGCTKWMSSSDPPSPAGAAARH